MSKHVKREANEKCYLRSQDSLPIERETEIAAFCLVGVVKNAFARKSSQSFTLRSD